MALPVVLERVSLVDVSHAAVRRSAEGRISDVLDDGVELVLQREGRIIGHQERRDDEIRDVAPVGVHGVVGAGDVGAGVEQVADQEAVVVQLGLHGAHDSRRVGLEVLVAEGPAAGEGVGMRRLGLEEVHVEVEEGGVGLDHVLVGDALEVQLGEERGQGGVELGLGLVDGHPGADVEEHGDHLVVDVHAVVDEVVGILVEDGGRLEPGRIVEGMGEVGVEGGADGGEVGEGLHGDGEDNGERGRAAALESPEEVGVLVLVGVGDLTGGGHDAEGEDVVDGEALEGGPRAVATTLDETTSDTHGGTLTGDDGKRGVPVVGSGQDGAALDTSSNGDGRSLVGTGALVAVDEVDVLEAMGVDDEGAITSAAANEVVAGVADDQTDVVLAGKVDTGLDVGLLLGHDDIDTNISETAAGVGVIGGETAGVGGIVPDVLGGLRNSPVLVRPAGLDGGAGSCVVSTVDSSERTGEGAVADSGGWDVEDQVAAHSGV